MERWSVTFPLALGLGLAKLGLQSGANRLPQHREPSVAPPLPRDADQAQEV